MQFVGLGGVVVARGGHRKRLLGQEPGVGKARPHGMPVDERGPIRDMRPAADLSTCRGQPVPIEAPRASTCPSPGVNRVIGPNRGPLARSPWSMARTRRPSRCRDGMHTLRRNASFLATESVAQQSWDAQGRSRPAASRRQEHRAQGRAILSHHRHSGGCGRASTRPSNRAAGTPLDHQRPQR